MSPDQVKFWQGCRASFKFFATHAVGLTWPKHYSEWETQIKENQWSLFESPRASWKTFFFSMAYPLWRILKGKTEVLLISDSEDQARKNLREIRTRVEQREELAPMRPTTKELWGTDMISFPNGSLAHIMGFGTSRRGVHPDVIVCDDIEGENNKMSREDRDRIFFSVILGMELPHTKTMVVGTPMERKDILAQIRDSERGDLYAKWRRPGRVNGINQFPDIWTDDWLDNRRSKMGPIGFAREVMLELVDPETQPFKKQYETLYRDVPPNTAYTVTVCDPAYNAGDGDFTAIVTVKFTHGNHAYVVDCKRIKRENPGDIVDELFRTIETQKPDSVGLPKKRGEAVSYTFEERRTRENRWDFRYVELSETKGKADITRIGGLVPRWEARSIHVHEQMKELLEELYMFRLDDSHPHDDAIDALAHCFNPEMARPNTGHQRVPMPEKATVGKSFYQIGRIGRFSNARKESVNRLLAGLSR